MNHLQTQWRKAAGKSGDRHVVCADGEVRWGAYGAAGLLVKCDGKYFMQKRGDGVDQGGTWGIPGGALEQGEDPKVGAMREFVEEVGVRPKGKVINVYVDKVTDDWYYTTVTIEVDDEFEHEASTWEGSHGNWFTPAQLKNLNLHPGFKAALPHLKLGKRQIYYHGSSRKLPLGTILEPQGPGRTSPTWDYANLDVLGDEGGSAWRGDVVWMSSAKTVAESWASYDTGGTGQYVYIVEPLGAVHKDPSAPESYYTTRARIVEEWSPQWARESWDNGYDNVEGLPRAAVRNLDEDQPWFKSASVGMHWTTDLNTAKDFAGRGGTVLVSVNWSTQIVEFDQSVLDNEVVYDFEMSSEKEITFRRGTRPAIDYAIVFERSESDPMEGKWKKVPFKLPAIGPRGFDEKTYSMFEAQYGIVPEDIDALYRGLPVPLDQVRTEW